MAHSVEEDYHALRVCEGSAFEPQVVRSHRAGRGRWLLAAFCAMGLLGAVLLTAERVSARSGPHAARAVSEAAAALRMGKAPSAAAGVVAGAQSLQGTPGMIPPPPEQGYNVFDPHYSDDGVPKSYPGGTVSSSFTGHSKGSKGGPLSFGPNTYWNVFDANGSPDLGPCDPGQIGTPGTATKKRECSECPVGKWCPGGADSLENECPDHSTSFAGSYKAEQCTCSTGWYGIAHYGSSSSSKAKSCKKCLAGTYCPGGKEQFSCPQHSSSPDEKAYCTCDPGYFGVTHDDCKLCDTNFFCPGGDPRGQQEYACPPNSLSPVGSNGGDDCLCAAKYYEPVPDTTTEGPDCVMCVANTYCRGGASNVNCPSNSKSPVGSSDPSACVCNAGYFGNANAGCTKCPAGSYCPGGAEKQACPAQSSSARGSSKLIECVCNTGYMGTGVEGCTICPVDSYCPGGGKVIQCTQHSYANAGSSKCTCRDSYTEKKDGTCFRCPVDFYCPPEQDHRPMQCPEFTKSPPGSIAPHNCKCLPGFENVAYDVSSSYFKVPAGDFEQVKTRCKQGGGEIASINSITEQMAALQVCDRCWIGFSCDSQGAPWKNVDNHPVDFTAWALGKPDATGVNFARACGASKNQACPAMQISTSHGGVAERAVDGSVDSTYNGASCTHTAGSPAGEKQWWRVDLQQDVIVSTLKIAGRADCCEDRTKGFSILVGNEEPGNLGKNAVCVSNQAHLPKVGGQQVTCDSPVRGRYVYFVIPPGQHLTLCEVDVFGFATVAQPLSVIYNVNSATKSPEWDDYPSTYTIQQCWVRMPTGCNRVLSETNTPSEWFVDQSGRTDAAGCASRMAAYNSHCGRNDAQNEWRGAAEGLCKKAAVPPTCTQIATPQTLGMNPGFITDFFYVGKAMSDFPYDVAAKSVPNVEVIADGIPFYDDNQWNKLDKTAPHDRFAGTWTGMLEVEDGGTYTFTTESDDGSHLYVDGTMVVDNGGLHGRTLKSGTIGLAPGYHVIKADWFENGGGANMVIQYKGPDTKNRFSTVEADHFKRFGKSLPDPATMGMSRGWLMRLWFGFKDLKEFPKVDQDKPQKTLVTSQVRWDDQKWASVGGIDNFAVILTGALPVYVAGVYEFWTTSDDGSNMYVDGIPVVLNGGLHGPRKKRGSIRLSHGFHFVVVDFFEAGGGALLDITYSGPDTENKEQAVDCFAPPKGVLNAGDDCWGGCNAKQGLCDWCGTGMCCQYGRDDKSNGCDGKIGVQGKGHVCSAPPPPPMIDQGPMAGVALKPLNGAGGPEMPTESRGRNDKCAQFANQALRKSKGDQLQMMAKCMGQDCEQSMESVGCKYVTPGPGFCYTDPGQLFCKSNPSSPQCVLNFADGGQWTPVANFPWIKMDDGRDPSAGGVKFDDATYSCVCALGCSYQKSIKALRCANGGIFVGPSGDSIFPKGLDQTKGVNGIIADGGKKKQCACICGKGDQWISTEG